MRHKMATLGRKGAIFWLATATSAAAGCGMGVKRDLSTTSPQAVIFDDVCGVQEYHDTLMMRKVQPPEVVTTNELERTDGKRLNGGRTTFAFEAPYQVQTIRRVLRENWSRVPDDIIKANRVEVEVRWSEKAGVRRVVTTEDAAIGTGTSREMQPLPYHVCLSELLFGAPLYKTRRELLGMSPLVVPFVPVAAPAPEPDAAPVQAAAPVVATPVVTPTSAPQVAPAQAPTAVASAPPSAAPVPGAKTAPTGASSMPAPTAAPIPAVAVPAVKATATPDAGVGPPDAGFDAGRARPPARRTK